ncbi:hypothetical protein FGO68_gene14169 [Halteria grandinella]|uniref:Uncharacterized protein n=1 Tax=Halteria grandinella TaxID=5974 RepID=A0A8J8NAF5_HALGN|nr:hypothetical protein FGO68_gene14169 [Halteria grandinella]
MLQKARIFSYFTKAIVNMLILFVNLAYTTDLVLLLVQALLLKVELTALEFIDVLGSGCLRVEGANVKGRLAFIVEHDTLCLTRCSTCQLYLSLQQHRFLTLIPLLPLFLHYFLQPSPLSHSLLFCSSSSFSFFIFLSSSSFLKFSSACFCFCNLAACFLVIFGARALGFFLASASSSSWGRWVWGCEESEFSDRILWSLECSSGTGAEALGGQGWVFLMGVSFQGYQIVAFKALASAAFLCCSKICSSKRASLAEASSFSLCFANIICSLSSYCSNWQPRFLCPPYVFLNSFSASMACFYASRHTSYLLFEHMLATSFSSSYCPAYCPLPTPLRSCSLSCAC